MGCIGWVLLRDGFRSSTRVQADPHLFYSQSQKPGLSLLFLAYCWIVGLCEEAGIPCICGETHETSFIDNSEFSMILMTVVGMFLLAHP